VQSIRSTTTVSPIIMPCLAPGRWSSLAVAIREMALISGSATSGLEASEPVAPQESSAALGPFMSSTLDNPFIVLTVSLVAQWLAAHAGDYIRKKGPLTADERENFDIVRNAARRSFPLWRQHLLVQRPPRQRAIALAACHLFLFTASQPSLHNLPRPRRLPLEHLLAPSQRDACSPTARRLLARH
jgi:hypothetical protein